VWEKMEKKRNLSGGTVFASVIKIGSAILSKQNKTKHENNYST